MIKNLLGAVIGGKLAEKTSTLGGTSGAVLGILAATVVKRISLPTMLALGAGSYLASRKNKAR